MVRRFIVLSFNMMNSIVIVILTMLLVALVACGEESTPVATSEPTAVATPTSASTTAATPVAPEATAPPVATPAATPTPVATVAPGTTAAPTPVPVAGAQPRGTLEVAIADLGPFSTLLYNQNFRYSVIETRTSNELGFVAEPDGSVLPRLVTRFELDETPEVAIYTFYLQGGVPWHSGLGDWESLEPTISYSRCRALPRKARPSPVPGPSGKSSPARIAS